MRILSIDPGNRRTGVAVCDDLEITVRPLTTVDKKKDRDVLGALLKVIQDQGVALIIVGVPLEADGQEGRAAKKSRSFMGRLERRMAGADLEIPILGVDESYTTTEAHVRLKDRGLGPEERKAVVDQEAAAVLLEDYVRSRREGRA